MLLAFALICGRSYAGNLMSPIDGREIPQRCWLFCVNLIGCRVTACRFWTACDQFPNIQADIARSSAGVRMDEWDMVSLQCQLVELFTCQCNKNSRDCHSTAPACWQHNINVKHVDILRKYRQSCYTRRNARALARVVQLNRCHAACHMAMP